MVNPDLPAVSESPSAPQESDLVEKDTVPEEHPSQTSPDPGLVEAERLWQKVREHHGLPDKAVSANLLAGGGV